MNTPFANWTPNSTFNTTPSWNANGGTPFGFQGWNPNFQQGWNGGWNQTGFNGFANSPFGFSGQNTFPTPHHFSNQNFSSPNFAGDRLESFDGLEPAFAVQWPAVQRVWLRPQRRVVR